MKILNCPKCGYDYGIPFWEKNSNYFLHCYNCSYNGALKKTRIKALLWWNNKKSIFKRTFVNYLDYDTNKIVNWDFK